MYQTYQNTLAVPAAILYDELKLMTRVNYDNYVRRGKITKLRCGGNGRVALIAFSSLSELFKSEIKKAYGDPYKQDDIERFIDRLENNVDASLFYQNYKDAEGLHLLPEKINQYYAESQILDLYDKLINDIRVKQHNGMRIKIGDAKKEICEVIKALKTLKDPILNAVKFPHNLPSNYRALDLKLSRYKKGTNKIDGYKSLIHGAIGNTNSKKIKGEIADWILAFYCLPNKPVVPILHKAYMKERVNHGWASITERAIQMWLNQTKQRKVWVLERHGLEKWRAEFGHKIRRDKSDWFPNCYWAIDGTKLDWVHYKDNTTGFGTDVKIDVVFDVYSERILGYSYSLSETHADHFNAVKMAVNNSMSRPYLFTYDGQSGHTSKTMQSLYGNLVAKIGGEHHKHAARQHGSPVEQLFSRFQKQILNTKWFSDKQGIKSKHPDSHANWDFIEQNKHQLSKIENLEKVFEQCVAEWNESIHPKFDESRLSVFENHAQLMQEQISITDMMELFWVTPIKSSKYETSGISITVTKQEYLYEVYDADGNVDLDFRDKYTHKNFFVQYDPSQMDNYVRLWIELPNKQRQYIADAQPKRLTKQIPALMTEKDKAQMHKDRHVKAKELSRIKKQIAKLKHTTGLTPEKLIEDQELHNKLGGKLPKQVRSKSESTSSWNRM